MYRPFMKDKHKFCYFRNNYYFSTQQKFFRPFLDGMSTFYIHNVKYLISKSIGVDIFNERFRINYVTTITKSVCVETTQDIQV